MGKMMRASLANGGQPMAPAVIRFRAEALLEKCTAATRHPDINLDNFVGYLQTKYEEALYEWETTNERDALLTPEEREALRLINETPEQHKASLRLSDALAKYLETHRNGQNPKFITDTKRAIAHVYSSVGDLPLTDFNRASARLVTDAIPGSKATKRRRLAVIAAVINMANIEFDLKEATNPFRRLEINGGAEDTQKREPFTSAELHTIREACVFRDDDLRWLIAFQMDTGTRLGEIVGLRRDDLFIEQPVPYVWIRSHPSLGRTLKTSNSERKVPLVGAALWGAKRAHESCASGGANGPAASGWLFPRYASDCDIRATAASATLNKWLGRLTGTNKTTHSFRHAMKDRLRAAGMPEDVQKALMGHGSRTVADTVTDLVIRWSAFRMPLGRP
jgi:integrase